jgi:ABC-type transport system substrate-binding protein
LLVVLLLLLSPSLFAGGGGEPKPAEGKGTTIIIAGEMDPGSLAPYGAEGPRNYPCWMLYETLARTNLEGKLEKILAKDIKQVADGVYQVTIYDYIHDTAGNHMTASDVVFSFGQFKKEGSGAAILILAKNLSMA